MREELKKKLGSRERFKGTFKKYSLKPSYKGLPKETILFVDVQTIEGQHITEHLWFNYTKGFKTLGTLYPGDVVAFDARVRPYMKGYIRDEWDIKEVDYKLSHPTKLEILAQGSKIEDHYSICPGCGYHNQKGLSDRCRRCGFTNSLLTEDQSFLHETSPIVFVKLKQTKLNEGMTE